jgi:hypothetical protein
VPPVADSGNWVPLAVVITTVVALVATTVNVDELPSTIEVGLALMVTVGFGAGVTVTVLEAVTTAPPAPVAVTV